MLNSSPAHTVLGSTHRTRPGRGSESGGKDIPFSFATEEDSDDSDDPDNSDDGSRCEASSTTIYYQLASQSALH